MRYFIIYNCCKLVVGYKGALLYDLSNNVYLNIPKIFLKYIDLKNNFIKVKDITQKNKEQNIILKFCSLLVSKNLGFFYNNPKHFSQISTEYETFHIIKHMIIVYNPNLNYNNFLILLNKLRVETLTIKIEKEFEYHQLIKLLNLIIDTNMISFVELIININLTQIYLQNFNKLLKIKYLVQKISVTKKFYSKIPLSIRKEFKVFQPIKLNENFDPRKYFFINLPFFIESQNYNTYFNQKIFINEKNNISTY